MKFENLKEFQLENGVENITGGQDVNLGWMKGKFTDLAEEFPYDAVMSE